METTKKIDWEQNWPNLLALYPFLAEDGGNYTGVMLQYSEGVVDTRKTKTVLTHLAKNFALDLALVKARGRKVLHCSREVPLVIMSELVLLPVKRREPPMKDAGSMGYVVLSQMAGWEDSPRAGYRTRILFHNQSYLDVLTSQATFRKRIAEAEQLLGDYHRRHQLYQSAPGFPVGYGWPSDGHAWAMIREKNPVSRFRGFY
ncbi:MAG: hypothetical protein WDA53_01035 [Bacillota bacterium]